MKNKLKRSIGFWGLTSNIINTIIGAGIFVLPAIVAAKLGSSSILAYLFCGFLITLVMLCFAEVGSKISHSGGAYAYIEVTFGKYFGFITAILFIISAVSADAAIANAIVAIINSIYPIFDNKFIKILFFLLLFSGLGYINIIGVKKGIRFVKFITIAKVIPLIILIFMGFSNIDIANLYWKTAPSIKDIGETALILFFAFMGAETALSINGEVKNPKKTVPKAIQASILLILAFYILIQTISQGILGDALSGFKENTLGEVAYTIIGPVGFTLLTIGAAVSMFGALSSDILSVPRILFGAAKDKTIPFNKLSLIHKKFETPYVAILVYVGLDLLFASLGGFKQLAILSSASILLIYLLVSLAVIKLRKKEKGKLNSGTFKIKGGLLVPITSALVILWFLSNLSKKELVVLILTIIFLSLVYYIKTLFQKKIKPKNTKIQQPEIY